MVLRYTVFLEMGGIALVFNGITIASIWNYCPGRESSEDYLPNDIINPHQLSYSQKKSVKKAILWLLSKTPHTVGEVADHFALSPELVKSLMTEFIRSGKLIIDKDPLRYRTVGH